MFVPLWLLVLAGVAFAILAFLAFRPRGGDDMIERQQRDAYRDAAEAPRAPHADDEAVLAVPEIRLALAGGNKIEAIKLVREHTGLGLKEAKELIERLQAR